MKPVVLKTVVHTKDTVKAHYALQGLDAVQVAKNYIAAWAAKVEPGTQMILARMKCALADGPCGCAEDSYFSKCTGPYPQVPIEIILEVLEAGVEGVEMVWLASSVATVPGDGHVHIQEQAGPAKSAYVKKL